MSTVLAAQCYSVRDYMQTAEGTYDSLKRLAQDGWQAVQLSGGVKLNPAYVREITEEFSLTIAATHIPPDDIFNNLGEVMKAHEIMDCRYIGIGAMPGQYPRTAEGFARFARELEPIAKKMADSGMRLIYHNHNFEFARFGETTGMDILLDNAPKELVFELDTYWVQLGGGDVREWIKKCSGRVDVIHFKDMVYDQEAQGPAFAEIGRGNLAWPKIIKACAKAGVRWHIVEQDTCKGNPFESLHISLEYLKSLGMH